MIFGPDIIKDKKDPYSVNGLRNSW
ncbi:hypothetical protein OIU78_016514, partial [Salix suchowensis]